MWNENKIKNEVGTSDVEDLITAAKTGHTIFTALMQATAQFVAKTNSIQPKITVDIKSSDSIERKARLKYGGNTLFVTDILRAQILLPNEEAMTCALLRIQRSCKESEGTLTIVRFKNLFRMSYLGVLVPSDLPTGYRHILINIRMKNGILAGEIMLYDRIMMMNNTHQALKSFFLCRNTNESSCNVQSPWTSWLRTSSRFGFKRSPKIRSITTSYKLQR